MKNINRWQGNRGELWVIAQGLLSVGFVVMPPFPAVDVPTLPPWIQILRWGILISFGAIASIFFLWGVLKLGENLTPLPHPKPDGHLVTDGIYQIVRHPLYSGVICLAIAYSSWQWSGLHLLGTGVFLIFFDRKANREEQWLSEKFSDYDDYQQQVKKLIPWIY